MPNDSDAGHRAQPPLRAPRCGPGPHGAAAAGTAPGTTARLSSRQLLGESGEVEIEHDDGAIYRLRRTSLGKLILTK